LDRVHQGEAFTVLPSEPVKVIAADLKGGDAARGILDPDTAQPAAPAQEKRPDKDVRRLVVLDTNHLPGTP